MMDQAETYYPARKPTRKKKYNTRNLSWWRKSIYRRDGGRCRACGLRGPADGSWVSAHHLIFKSHCAKKYVDDPRNGILLCNEWGNGCHQLVHARRLEIRKSWLPPEVVECLAEQVLVWDEFGEPVGTLAVYFAKEEI